MVIKAGSDSRFQAGGSGGSGHYSDESLCGIENPAGISIEAEAITMQCSAICRLRS